MRTYTTLLVAACLTLGAYALPGCDQGGSKTEGPRPQTATTPGAGSTEGTTSANTPAATPNPNGGGAGSVDASHGAIQPDKASSSSQHPNTITHHQD